METKTAHPTHERAHPGPKEYVKIAAALAIVTMIEVAIYYLDALRPVLVPSLLVLSAIKFALVVLWFMHLRFDSRMYARLFAGGLALAITLFIIVLLSFGVLFR